MPINFGQPTPLQLRPEVTGMYTQADYEEFIFTLPKGEVFSFDPASTKYETVHQEIERYTPEQKLFCVRLIQPGTLLYSIYGNNHLLITENNIDTNS